jgi:hypothetical protein
MDHQWHDIDNIVVVVEVDVWWRLRPWCLDVTDDDVVVDVDE